MTLKQDSKLISKHGKEKNNFLLQLFEIAPNTDQSMLQIWH